jgi:hypothetical protein
LAVFSFPPNGKSVLTISRAVFIIYFKTHGNII